jgi:hypothetical protein
MTLVIQINEPPVSVLLDRIKAKREQVKDKAVKLKKSQNRGI